MSEIPMPEAVANFQFPIELKGDYSNITDFDEVPVQPTVIRKYPQGTTREMAISNTVGEVITIFRRGGKRNPNTA